MSLKFTQSILVSNVFDPISHNSETLINLYKMLSIQNRYRSIETRVSDDLEHVKRFSHLIEENNWIVTGWVTGDISRAGLNPSDLNESKRYETEVKLKEMMNLAILNRMTYFGLASGPHSNPININESLSQFKKTLDSLLFYAERKINIIVEPLDSFSHKRNVLGTTATVFNFFKNYSKEIQDGTLSICWDSAHFALNNDDFDNSIQILAPFISRIHFSNSILDKTNPEFGDNHMKFVKPGFLTKEISKNIIHSLINSRRHQSHILIANEIRSTAEDNLWELEEFCYNWINEALIK